MGIQEIIAESLAFVRDDPQHELGISFRCRLLSYLDKTNGGAGRRRRTMLAALGVEKVMPLWESLLPMDHLPRHALDLADKILTGGVTSAPAESEMGRLWTHCDDLSWRHPDKQSVIMVGYGAVQTVREAMSEMHFGCDGVSDGSADVDVDPYDYDSAFCAMIAFSGGPPWDETSDVQKRLEFWTWWLTSAVQTALTVT